MHKIQLSEMAPHIHSFLPHENKVDKLSKWLISWITISLSDGKIKPNDLLPSKGDLACHIGVSLGTVQNVYRFVEDAGYIESKQKIGSYIKDRDGKILPKLTSKKDIACNVIKKFLKDNNYKKGDALPSTRRLSAMIDIPLATIRAAVLNLVLQGILERKKNLFILTGRSFRVYEIQSKTLVSKVASGIKKYIEKDLKAGDKLTSSTELAKKFKVSVKTIHDAIKELSKEGIVYTRRGRYGTIVADKDKNNPSIIYNYEKIEHKLRKVLSSDYKVGDKLPAIKKLAKKYDTSEKTIKKALDNLSEDGYLTSMRGRYGGTFVTDIPQDATSSYKWLAINSDFIGSGN